MPLVPIFLILPLSLAVAAMHPAFLSPVHPKTGAELFPHVQNYTLDHSSYNCGDFHVADNRGFPTPRADGACVCRRCVVFSHLFPVDA